MIPQELQGACWGQELVDGSIWDVGDENEQDRERPWEKHDQSRESEEVSPGDQVLFADDQGYDYSWDGERAVNHTINSHSEVHQEVHQGSLEYSRFFLRNFHQVAIRLEKSSLCESLHNRFVNRICSQINLLVQDVHD